MKIAVGISGGVDSSVAAYLLKKQGHEVIGLWMDLFGRKELAEDARKVAESLEVPFYTIDLKQEYEDKVISYIKNEYSSGRTPNPCVICNRTVKFGRFIEKAYSSSIPFDKFATGHYAVVERNSENGRCILKKGDFSDKDQAYFLALLTQEQLSRIIFPLGKMSKEEVRAIASEAGLFTADKTESQDLCSGDYRNFIKPDKGPGNFLNKEGEIIGTHKGVEHYTVGQRRGLGISSSTDPYYVLKILPENNQVVLGYDKDLENRGMIVGQCNWISVEKPDFPLHADTKIRYRDSGTGSIITSTGNNRLKVEFETVKRAVTPGQLAVFYNGKEVLGAGIIESGF